MTRSPLRAPNQVRSSSPANPLPARAPDVWALRTCACRNDLAGESPPATVEGTGSRTIRSGAFTNRPRTTAGPAFETVQRNLGLANFVRFAFVVVEGSLVHSARLNCGRFQVSDNVSQHFPAVCHRKKVACARPRCYTLGTFVANRTYAPKVESRDRDIRLGGQGQCAAVSRSPSRLRLGNLLSP